MGILDDAKKAQADMIASTQQGGGFGMANYGAGQGEVNAIRERADALEATGPEFEPVEGIGWDRYIDLCILMADAGMDTAKHEQIAVANGVSAGTWAGITQTWLDRMTANQTMMQKFSTEYGRRTGVI